jgi:dihydrofolate reductase
LVLTLIAIVGANRVIGLGGRVPWHLDEDLARFKALTSGHPVVMGRKTWETLQVPLVGRENVVITRQGGYKAAGARIARDLDEALAPYWATPEEVFVAGGGEVYREALPFADRLVLTLVEESPPGDTHFPELPQGVFEEVSREERAGPPRHAFVTYGRRR